MDIPSLFDLATCKLATFDLRGKTSDEMCKILRIVPDFPPEEIEERKILFKWMIVEPDAPQPQGAAGDN